MSQRTAARAAFRLIGITGLFLLGLAGEAAAQEEISKEVRAFRQGTQAFRRILFDLGMTPLSNISQLRDSPEKTILIVLGETRVFEDIDVRGFLTNGGAVLVATDRTSRDLESSLNITFFGLRFQVPRDSPHSYRESGDCIFVQPIRQTNVPVFRSLDRVATNRPGWLRSFRNGPPTVAVFPPEHFASNGSAVRFAVGGAWGNGRILALSDHSVFINDMLMQTDNDNLYFAFNCAEWLGEKGKRTRVLFVEDDRIQTTFESPLGEPTLPPLPPLDHMVPIANKALAGLQDENVFQQIFNENFYPFRVRRFAIVSATLALVVVGMMLLAKMRHRAESTEPLLTALLAQQPAPLPGLAQRQAELLESGNVWEPARALARETLLANFGALASLREAPPAQPPRIEVAGSWWQRWVWDRRWRRAWRLGFGDEPEAIRPDRLRSIERDLEEIALAAKAGALRLADRVDTI